MSGETKNDSGPSDCGVKSVSVVVCSQGRIKIQFSGHFYECICTVRGVIDNKVVSVPLNSTYKGERCPLFSRGNKLFINKTFNNTPLSSYFVPRARFTLIQKRPTSLIKKHFRIVIQGYKRITKSKVS